MEPKIDDAAGKEKHADSEQGIQSGVISNLPTGEDRRTRGKGVTQKGDDRSNSWTEGGLWS